MKTIKLNSEIIKCEFCDRVLDESTSKFVTDEEGELYEFCIPCYDDLETRKNRFPCDDVQVENKSWLKKQEEELRRSFIDDINNSWKIMGKSLGWTNYYHKNYNGTYCQKNINSDNVIMPRR